MKFDIDLFWSLPRTILKFRDDWGYCALGAGYKASGLSDLEIDESKGLGVDNPWNIAIEKLRDIYWVNDIGYTEQERSELIGWDCPSFKSKPNPERAKRMLLELLITEGVVDKADLLIYENKKVEAASLSRVNI